MTIQSLAGTPFSKIADAFITAFTDYFVPMPTDPGYYRKRWQTEGVRFDLSYGAFQDDQLTAFILHALDERDGHLTTYNAGTGVIPPFRGQHLVSRLYEYAIPELKNAGVSRSTLEVITKNQTAIRAYEKAGFTRTRYYRCYQGDIQLLKAPLFTLVEKEHHDFNWQDMPGQDFYSWDNHYKTLDEGDYRYFEVWADEVRQSYFVMHLPSGYIAQLDMFDDYPDGWQRLMAAIASQSHSVKINNVDDRLNAKIEALEAAGLENTVDQFEMELYLS